MDYQYQYNELVRKSKLNENIIIQSCFEKHHIVPKCMGGGDNKENIVKLSVRAHFIAHRLLCKIYPNDMKLAKALYFMSVKSSIINGRKFENVKNHYYNFVSPTITRKRYKRGENLRGDIIICKNCNKIIKTRRKFCDKHCHDDYQRNNFYRPKEIHEKMVNAIRKNMDSLSESEKKIWMDRSLHSDKVDHVARGKKISAAKKGRPTNQYEIMGRRVAGMTENEFITYLSTLKSSTHKRFINLRTKWKNILQLES